MKNKLQILTTEWLIKRGGCVEGVKWFRKNYPNGLDVTKKKNINELVGKLLKKRSIWYACNENKTYDACNNLEWLLTQIRLCYCRRVKSGNELGFGMNDWAAATQKEITNGFWSAYKLFMGIK